jgi:HD-GYP domain-containing protein (c-di-GMP phosphodiesterase class II)
MSASDLMTLPTVVGSADAEVQAPPRLKGVTRVYIGLVIALAALLFAASSVADGAAVRSDAPRWMALILAGAAALAGRFPLHLTYQTKVYVDTSIYTAMALTLGVREALLAAVVSVVVSQAFARTSIAQIAFNAAQTGLYVGSGTLVFLVLRHAFDVGVAPAIAGCAVAMHLLNTLLVSTIGALEAGVEPHRAWRADLWLELPEHVALVIFGVLMAMISTDRPWALPLFALPLAIVYVSLRRSNQARVGARIAVESLASIVELRDPDKAGHSERVAAHVAVLAERLGLPANESARITAAARIHDVGDVALDPAIFRIEGPLSRADWDLVRRHPIVGADLVSSLPAYVLCATFIRHHHERWDGLGYPDGLRGEEIPLGARMIAVADGFDAMTSPRPHRAALSVPAALSELQRGAGSQWDPELVAAFVEMLTSEDARTQGWPEAIPRPELTEPWGVVT